MFGRVHVCITGICIYSKRGNVYIVKQLLAKLLYSICRFMVLYSGNNQYTFIDAWTIKHKNLPNGINKQNINDL